jgi:sigma-E factor negative regulatory protein RseC
MLFGAWLGAAFDGSDGATALGAIAGFLGALAIARVAIGLVPGLMPAPQLIPISNDSPAFPKE